MTRRLIECRRCHRTRPHSARGLCASCSAIASRDGTLDDYPKHVPTHRKVIEEWDHMRGLLGEYGAVRRLADAYDTSENSIRKMLERHEVAA